MSITDYICITSRWSIDALDKKVSISFFVNMEIEPFHSKLTQQETDNGFKCSDTAMYIMSITITIFPQCWCCHFLKDTILYLVLCCFFLFLMFSMPMFTNNMFIDFFVHLLPIDVVVIKSNQFDQRTIPYTCICMTWFHSHLILLIMFLMYAGAIEHCSSYWFSFSPNLSSSLYHYASSGQCLPCYYFLFWFYTYCTVFKLITHLDCFDSVQDKKKNLKQNPTESPKY